MAMVGGVEAVKDDDDDNDDDDDEELELAGGVTKAGGGDGVSFVVTLTICSCLMTEINGILG